MGVRTEGVSVLHMSKYGLGNKATKEKTDSNTRSDRHCYIRIHESD